MAFIGKGAIPAIGIPVEIGLEKFDSGLNSVKSKLSSFGSHPAFAAIGIGFAGIAAAGAAVTAAAGGALVVMQQMTAAGFEHAASLEKQAKAAHLSAQFLGEVQHAARGVNVEAEMLTDTWLAFQVQLGIAAKTGVGPVVDNFDRLGISLSDIANAKPEEQFLRMSDAVAGLGSHADKVAFLSEMGMDPKTVALWEMGSEKIEEAAAHARQLGLVLSDEQTAGINIAARSTKDLGLAWAAISDQFAAAVSPAIWAVTEEIKGFIEGGNNWGGQIESLVDETVYRISWVVELGSKAAAEIQGLQFVTTKAIKTMVDGIWLFAKVSDQVFKTDLANGLDIYSQELGFTLKEIQKSMKQNDKWGEGSNGDKFLKWYEERKAAFKDLASAYEAYGDTVVKNPADDEAESYLKSLQKSIDVINSSADAVELKILAEKGVNGELLKQIEARQKELTLLGEQKKKSDELEAASKSYLAMIQTDAQKMGEEMARLREVLGAKLIDDGQFARIQEAIEKKYRGGSGSQEVGVARAMERGSQEANELIARFKSGKNYEADTAKNTKDLVLSVTETNRILTGRVAATSKNEKPELI